MITEIPAPTSPVPVTSQEMSQSLGVSNTCDCLASLPLMSRRTTPATAGVGVAVTGPVSDLAGTGVPVALPQAPAIATRTIATRILRIIILHLPCLRQQDQQWR